MRILLAALMMLTASAYAQSGGGGMSPGRDADGGGVRGPGVRVQPRGEHYEGQQAQVPELCEGDECAEIGEPTGTGLGDRGIRQGDTDPYDLGDSPVEGGPAITGPTGRELNVPRPERDR